VRERQDAILQRAILDPDRAVAVYVGFDDVSQPVSREYLYLGVCMAEIHCLITISLSCEDHLPLAQLNKPNDDIAVMKAWVADCVKNHPMCRNGSKSFVPTRLLDVEAFDNSNDIRLVRLDLKLSPTRYVALSHCWGPSTHLPITTMTSTLDNRMKRINFGHLSQTFQDAVKLARQLGQRYLWIDSLCIIQDDKDDWAIESGA
jgi:hypothetical protein